MAARSVGEQLDPAAHVVGGLGGGEGGIQRFMDTLMPRMVDGWPGLGNPELTPDLAQQIVKGVLDEADGKSIDELAHERDEMLFGLIALRDQQ